MPNVVFEVKMFSFGGKKVSKRCLFKVKMLTFVYSGQNVQLFG